MAWQILKVAEAIEHDGGRVTLGMLGDLVRGSGGGSYGVAGGGGRGRGKAKEKVGLDLEDIAGGKVKLSKDVSDCPLSSASRSVWWCSFPCQSLRTHGLYLRLIIYFTGHGNATYATASGGLPKGVLSQYRLRNQCLHPAGRKRAAYYTLVTRRH
jgi:hypothetical protein